MYTVSGCLWSRCSSALQWRHTECDGVSNNQPHECLLNRLFRHRWKKTSKLGVTGLCEGNSLVTGEFPAQMVSIAENVSIWWRHHEVGHQEHMATIKDKVVGSGGNFKGFLFHRSSVYKAIAYDVNMIMVVQSEVYFETCSLLSIFWSKEYVQFFIEAFFLQNGTTEAFIVYYKCIRCSGMMRFRNQQNEFEKIRILF